MRIFITLLLLLTTVHAQAKLYKWVDEGGEVHYSDSPPARDMQSLDLPPLQTTPAVKYTPRKPAEQAKPEADTFRYNKFAISSPENNATIRDNAGNLTVALAIDPPLNLEKNHYINILLDDRIKINKSKNTSITLSFVDRGSHTLTAELRSAAGKLLKTSNTVTIHMHRFSKLHKKAP
ncbi:MAG: DUF4124 domain-containing protein [Gammaproteobacteria bacterium]|nr:DUF4124 domain-containing protein [Gammaproteobacteria bacterium]